MTDPVTMRRVLRVELRRLRMARNLTQKDVAEALDWSQSKVIRMENGSVGVTITDLRALLLYYGVTDDATIEPLVKMARGSKHQPFASYRGVFRPETLRYFQYESSASLIRQVEPLLMPGLLQTEEYARSLLAGWDIEPSQVERIWESRAERQELLERETTPQMFFILDEAVLRRPIGGDAVMHKQLEYLLELHARPLLEIQVLPFSLGAQSALRGPFVYLEFPEADNPDVLYVESALGDAVFRDDLDVTESYLERFLKLETQASRKDDLEKVLRPFLDRR